ncbi:hypothetical protein SAY86_003628 [Trapa natans]|uniref:Uncharacterized protein n=1 Tax=Trapa natans TaxID=22666 RepID=A0AAN7N247_TRANT|nr:hypothetical protein SAY86_003628 [Trapa natans]
MLGCCACKITYPILEHCKRSSFNQPQHDTVQTSAEIFMTFTLDPRKTRELICPQKGLTKLVIFVQDPLRLLKRINFHNYKEAPFSHMLNLYNYTHKELKKMHNIASQLDQSVRKLIQNPDDSAYC